MVKYVNNLAEFQAELTSAGDTLVVVDFTASWCGPCRQIAPIFEQMAKDYPQVVFLKVDVDEASDVSQKYDIKCMPTFKFFKNKQVIDEMKGADVKGLMQKVQQHV